MSFYWSRLRTGFTIAPVVSDDDLGQQTGWWLNARIFGRPLSLFLPWRRRLARP